MRGKNSQAWECRACKKRAYGSKGRAEEAMHTIRSHSDRDKKPIRAYPCPYGNGWHMTSKEERDSDLSQPIPPRAG